jgi:hypothetical protein
MARHHESKKSHMGMGGHYEGREGRRYEEMLSGGMISEDHSAIANMPQNVMIKPYPKSRHYMGEGLDDTINGIDKQMEEDAPRGRNYAPHKF